MKNSTLKHRSFLVSDDQSMVADFYNKNHIITSYMIALSVVIPDAERMLIDTFREVKDLIDDPVLKAQISGFISQEAHHSQAHRAVNKIFSETCHVDLMAMEREFKTQVMDVVAKKPLAERLAMIAAFEHFTAIFGEFMLKRRMTDELPEIVHSFMLWHSIEEIEHKSVAFDVYQAISKKNKWIRFKCFLSASKMFLTYIKRYQKQIILEINPQPTLKMKIETFSYFFGLQGLVSSNVFKIQDYLKADFHPTQHEQDHLIDQWEERFPEIMRYLKVLG